MRPSVRPLVPPTAAITRLAALAPLSALEMDALREAERGCQRITPHREIMVEGALTRDPGIILSGWAFRVRQFADGRRQILSLLLPGELIGMDGHRRPRASSTLVALTEVVLCPVPDMRDHDGLREAYAVSRALEEAYLFRQIARLGRMSAYERIADWLLEIRDRLGLADPAHGNRLPMPLTQEMLADTLGLTSVHVNRTLQLMRRDRLVEWRGGTVVLTDPQALAALIDYQPVVVTHTTWSIEP